MLPILYSDHNAAVDAMSSTWLMEQSRRSSSSKFISKPSWLLLSISDMEDKIQAINGEDKPDTFAERAELYYHNRPQLLALLQDLYNRYLYLANRYTRTLSKHQQKSDHQQEDEVKCVVSDDNTIIAQYMDDSESSLSCQPPKRPDTYELVISELIMKFVEYEMMVDELETTNMIKEESKKKIELQKSLLEVLESERVVLINENARLASECLFMKRKAGDLARCMLLERSEDHRVFVLGRKIDSLQGQIYKLEKRNKEYYDKLAKEGKKSGANKVIKRLMTKSTNASSSSASLSGGEEEASACSVSTSTSSNTCTSVAQVMKPPRGSGGGSGWWDRVRKFEIFMCGPHLDSTCC